MEVRKVIFGNGLSGNLFIPDRMDKKIPAVILCHGLGSEGSAMEKSARIISSNGLASLVFDFRGHGQSKGELDEKIYEDVNEAFSFIKSLDFVDKNKICIVGHSLGAFSSVVASHRLIHRVFALVVLSCPWDIGGHPLIRNKISRFAVTLVSKMIFKFYDWFYRDLKVRINWERFWKLFRVNRTKEILELTDCYKLFVFGLQDLITPYRLFMPAYQYISEPKQMMLISGDHVAPINEIGWIRWLIDKIKE